MLAGHPPFVLSDAFPGDLLPLPVCVRLADIPEGMDRKKAKRARWVTKEQFLNLRANGNVRWDQIRSDDDVFCDDATRHNTLARDCDASLEEAGLFSRQQTRLRTKVPKTPQRQAAAPRRPTLIDNPALDGADYLSLYFRAVNQHAAELLLDLLYELSLIGFGADVAIGRGKFEILADPEPEPDLDDLPNSANGLIILSTFQPGPSDPIDGWWETFPKFAKLGPDLGLSDVRKNTLIMFRPGACFRADPARCYLGRALPMDSILSADLIDTLRSRDIELIHPAFGLAVAGKFEWAYQS
jgi:CRISPR-associated protein Csm4